MTPSRHAFRRQGGEPRRPSGHRRRVSLQQVVQRLVARDKAQAATIRKLEQELDEVRAALTLGPHAIESARPNVTLGRSTKLPNVELVNGRTVPRALYEDVRSKLAILMKQHLRIVASKARNSSMVVSDRDGNVEFHVSERYGLGNHRLSHREAFHRLGLVDAHGQMPDDIAAIVAATTEIKGNNIELSNYSTTEEIASIELQVAEERRADELAVRARQDEEARRLERRLEEEQRLRREREEGARRVLELAVEARVARERMQRQKRHRHRRRWIQLRRWARIQWQEFRRL